MYLKFRGRRLGFFHFRFGRIVFPASIPMSLNEKLDPENMGVAVGISLISCLGAEIYVFERRYMYSKFRGRRLGFFHFRFGRIVFL